MAPSRRKGGSKASAAAAACRQWKVGDLVLAKVKGFPAWPATVSEPGKWGYSVDWKKVLVYFFGTKQIAFCNPADVEAFTEEKKESLLIKRHRKGADFVRAVHEIIDSYEKLKKQDQVAELNSGDEITATNAANGGNSSESLDNFGLKDQAEAPTAALDSCLKTAYSETKSELSVPVDGAVATNREGDLHDRDLPSEEPIDNLVGSEKPLVTTYSSRRRLGGVHLQSRVRQNGGPSARRSRSSSMVDSNRFQKLNLPSSNGGKNSANATDNVFREGFVRRDKRTRKSPDVTEGRDGNSPAFLSNGSIEENDSEIATVESDTVSLNEGSTVESVVECGEADLELIQTLDFQTKSVFSKKKRKPNRKRVRSHTTEVAGGPDKEAASEMEAQKTEQVSPNAHELSNERYSKEDGDEHLPLVKRARVRMGRLSSAGDDLDCADDCPVDKNSYMVERAVDNLSPPHKGPQLLVNKPQVWGGKKSQQFGCSVDGEAALPPSKRLHRALEAMSANVAEDGQTCSEMPLTMKTFNGSCISSSNNASQEGMSGFPMCSNPPVTEECAKSLLEVSICNNPPRSSSSPKEAVECSVDKDLSESYLGTESPELVVMVQSPKPGSPNLGRELDSPRCNRDPLSDVLPSRDDCKNENPHLSNHVAEKPVKELDPSEHSGGSSDPILKTVETSKCLSQNGTKLLLGSSEGNCKTTKLQELPLDENDPVNRMCETEKEIKPTHNELDAIPSSTSGKVMVASVPDQPHLSRTASDDRSGEKGILGTRSSSSPAEGSESAAHPSPSNTSICNFPRSDNFASLENNGYCSPGFHLRNDKPKHAAKWSNKAEATAALTSFESILRTLTRTKECIGRATRIAIDCARFGFAPKVVEILARNLERESSLHRRVDFFFLVDSITRCSQGLKGDGGGIYPSAIQAALPRLLSAAAPPRSSAQENRRQCLKVLRLWLERRILPESVLRPHIRELDSFGSSSSTGPFSRRPLRTERPFDDPIRQMEGMHVDEYGSNSSFQLPGFRMPPMLKDEEDERSDSDGGSFEAVTPEHNSETPEERERVPMPAIEKHRHILEDVDGELEMEDLAPSCEPDMNPTGNVAGVNAVQTSNHSFEHRFPHSFAPPLPNDVPPSSPPLPISPPPPPAPPIPPSAMAEPNCLDSKLFIGTHNEDSIARQSVAQGVNPISDAVHYSAPDCRDLQMQMQIPDPVSSGSFSGIPVSHPPIRPSNSVQQTDAAPYHLRPPHPAPSNQFSYVQADQRVQSQREIPPPPHTSRYHFPHNMDGGNFYSDHDRMNLGPPHEQGESWRFSGHSFSGSHYPDNARLSYAPAPYTGPPCEPPLPNNRWHGPPRPMNHGEFMPHRPTYEGPVPVSMRAPNFWRPR